jgi:trans-feruloyl-CoA hydratase/vanillin synthase
MVAGAKTQLPEQSYKTGLSQFIDQKSYKPLCAPLKLGTMLSDQRK